MFFDSARLQEETTISAHPRLGKHDNVASLDNESNHASDHPKLATVEDREERRNDRSQENVTLLLAKFLVLSVRRQGRRRIPDNIELREACEKKGEDGEGLGWGEVAKKSREEPLALRRDKEGNEWVGEAVTTESQLSAVESFGETRPQLT